MKKTVSLLLCLVMLLALCACGSQAAAPAPETPAPSAAPVEETPAQPESDALVVDTMILKEADDNMINILIYHGDLVSENQTSKYNPITVREIENSNFDYIALGHIHSATTLQRAGYNTNFSFIHYRE